MKLNQPNKKFYAGIKYTIRIPCMEADYLHIFQVFVSKNIYKNNGPQWQ